MKVRSIPILLAALALGAGARATPAKVTISGKTTREASVQPGERLDGRIVLENHGTEPGRVRVYATDYRFTADGRNEYGSPGSTPRSNAPWLTFAPQELTVPGGETATVDYAIRVPSNTALAGTYWSILMVEPRAAESATPKNDKPSVAIQTVIRYAVQIVTHIGASGTSRLRFLGQKLISDEDRRTLQVDLENTGERWLIPKLFAEVYSESGASAGRFPGEQLRLYPGCSARFHIDVSSLAKGDYRALLVADNGDDNVFGTQVTFSVPY